MKKQILNLLVTAVCLAPIHLYGMESIDNTSFATALKGTDTINILATRVALAGHPMTAEEAYSICTNWHDISEANFEIALTHKPLLAALKETFPDTSETTRARILNKATQFMDDVVNEAKEPAQQRYNPQTKKIEVTKWVAYLDTDSKRSLARAQNVVKILKELTH